MDWPYDDADDSPQEPPGSPTWVCPDDHCTCHEAELETEEHEFSVMLLNPIGERMGGAACRITYQGRVINEDSPNADPEGWITSKVPRVPTTVLVEWAPPEKPMTEGFPYRRRYHVELSDDRQRAARRRLDNLGYSAHFSLEDNIKDFQRTYGYGQITGKLDDIEDDLIEFHDEGRPPSLRPTSTASVPAPPASDPGFNIPILSKGNQDDAPIVHTLNAKSGDGGTSKLVPDAKTRQASPQAKAGPPPRKGAISRGVGSAKPGLAPPTIEKLIDTKRGLFELVSLKTEWTDPKDASRSIWGHFWIFADAMLWEVPNDATWGFWGGTAVSQRIPTTSYDGGVTSVGVRDDKRLVRPQCTGEDAQKSVRKLLFSQADLLKYSAIRDTVDAKPGSNDAKVACILPTTRLYNELYFQSRIKIVPQNLPIEFMKKPMEGTLLYAENVADEVARQSASVTIPSGFGWSLGTPGKIWALGKHMETWWFCKTSGLIEFACINHGFHTGMKKVGAQNQAKAIQAPGGCHNWAHSDYSQIFMAVADWCFVKDFSGSTSWKRTSDLLLGKHGDLFHLGRTMSALKSTEYVGPGRQAKPASVQNPSGSVDDEPHLP